MMRKRDIKARVDEIAQKALSVMAERSGYRLNRDIWVAFFCDVCFAPLSEQSICPNNEQIIARAEEDKKSLHREPIKDDKPYEHCVSGFDRAICLLSNSEKEFADYSLDEFRNFWDELSVASHSYKEG